MRCETTSSSTKETGVGNEIDSVEGHSTPSILPLDETPSEPAQRTSCREASDESRAEKFNLPGSVDDRNALEPSAHDALPCSNTPFSQADTPQPGLKDISDNDDDNTSSSYEPEDSRVAAGESDSQLPQSCSLKSEADSSQATKGYNQKPNPTVTEVDRTPDKFGTIEQPEASSCSSQAPDERAEAAQRTGTATSNKGACDAKRSQTTDAERKRDDSPPYDRRSPQSKVESPSRSLEPTVAGIPGGIAYQSDPKNYDGDLLFRLMVVRCVEHFGTTPGKQARWTQYLNRTRSVRVDAAATAKEMCELAENNEDFCRHMQGDLALLYKYEGGSTWSSVKKSEPPTPAQAAPGSKKPQPSCLTCLHKGRPCEGAGVTDGKCQACYKTRQGKARGSEDECYWEQEELGIRSYGNAQDYYGAAIQAALKPPRAHKRKRDESDSETIPSKRVRMDDASKYKALYIPVFDPSKTPGIRITIRRYAYYEHGTEVKIGKRDLRVDIGKYNNLRHALIFAVRSTIEKQAILKKNFGTQPRYVFKIQKT